MKLWLSAAAAVAVIAGGTQTASAQYLVPHRGHYHVAPAYPPPVTGGFSLGYSSPGFGFGFASPGFYGSPGYGYGHGHGHGHSPGYGYGGYRAPGGYGNGWGGHHHHHHHR